MDRIWRSEDAISLRIDGGKNSMRSMNDAEIKDE